ncbi:Hpt domain-containing protein [Gammaproteobacteria bacterium]|nr:Hpt domain-containing protein [Gammaproteobacteria bacterium]
MEKGCFSSIYIDKDQLNATYANDKKTIKGLLDLFIKELDKTSMAIPTSFKSQNIEKLIFVIHSLIGASAYCCANILRDQATAFEKQLKEHKDMDHSVKISEITYAIDRSRKEVIRLLHWYDGTGDAQKKAEMITG